MFGGHTISRKKAQKAQKKAKSWISISDFIFAPLVPFCGYGLGCLCAARGHAHDFRFVPLRAGPNRGELAAAHHADRVAERAEAAERSERLGYVGTGADAERTAEGILDLFIDGIAKGPGKSA